MTYWVCGLIYVEF